MRPRLASCRLVFALLAAVLGNVGCSKSPDTVANSPAPAPVFATMETDHGTIEIELLPAAAPKTVENFRLLSQRGFYNGLTFHRIVKGFMIQGGDPLGTGMGGESAWGGKFDDEIERHSPLYQNGYKRGSVAMANSGKNTNTSQFFIIHQDYPLPPDYTIFGRVVSGLDVVDALANVRTVPGPDGNMSKPVTPPVIKKVTIHGPPPPAEAKK